MAVGSCRDETPMALAMTAIFFIGMSGFVLAPEAAYAWAVALASRTGRCSRSF